MPDPIVDPAADPNAQAAAAAAEKTPDPNASLLDGGDIAKPAAAPAAAAKPADDAKAQVAKAAEEKRLLEADDATLSPEDKTKKEAIIKEQADKKLLETPDDKLSAEDKAKKDALVKAKADADKPKAQGAPEKYADFKLPEGAVIDPELSAEFQKLAKEDNLSQEKAQRYVDLQAKVLQKMSDELLGSFTKVVTEWKKETVDTLGPEYKKELAFASKALDKFGTPALRQLLNKSGVGNNKDMVNAWIAIGKAISEDKLIVGAQKSGKKEDKDVFYPNMPK